MKKTTKRPLSWREHCAPIIAQVIAEHPDEDVKTIRKALLEAYPYGQKAMHPYRIWCSEIRKQLGLRTKKELETKITDQLNLFDV